jgi:Cof subfamily protein (haloacid dehalogenase superfamily)
MFKLAALDLDGTLLGHDGQISPENAQAVQRLQRSGIEVVLASGRHYLNMRSCAESLPGVRWIVSCQGGEAANVDRKQVLLREFLPAPEARLGVKLGRSLGFTTLVYGVDGIITDSAWNNNLAFYSELSGRRPVRSPSQQTSDGSVFKVLWVGEPGDIEAAREETAVLGNVQAIRTHKKLLEIMPMGVSKASALRIVAESLDIDASETIVFGDGDNDVPMFEWAGASFAMAHGWPAALQTATYITEDGSPNTALARGVDMAYAKGLLLGDQPESLSPLLSRVDS